MSSSLPIFIIEDEDLIREGLRQFLEWEGFTVVTASNGHRGLELLREHQGASLIVVDLQMPVMTGEQFIEALQTETTPAIKHAPVLVLTARSKKFTHPGIVGVISKPLDLEDFITTVKRFYIKP